MQLHTGRAATVSDTAVFYQSATRIGAVTRSLQVAGGVLHLDAALDPGDESIVSSEEIGYTLTPALVAPQNASAPVTATGVTVTATLPPSLVSVDTSTVDPAWSVQQTGDLQTGFVLTFTYVGAATASSDTALPPIEFTATSSIQAPASGSIVVPAVISADDNDQPEAERTATVTTTVSQADVTTIQKVVDGPTQIPVGTSEVAWQLGWYNYRSVSVGATAVVDVLPFDGDGRGNDFGGTLRLTDVELIGDATAGTTLSYTTADPQDVLADPWSDSITWTTLPADPSEVTGITAVRADVDDLRVTYAGGIRLTAAIDDAAVGDVFVNSDIAYLEDFPGHVLGPVTAQPITVVGATITGRLWWDRDRDGVRDGDELPVADIPVEITTPSGASHRTSTDAAGGYRVDGLGAGEHTVSVDESVLGSLAGLEFTAQGAGADRSVDSDVATTGTTPVTVGVGTEHQVDAGLVDTQFTVSKSVRSAPGSDTFIEADASDGLTGQYTWGDTADWRIVVRNTGHTDLDTLVVTDPGLTPTAESADSCRALTEDGVTLDRLAPDESVTLECSSPVTVPHTNVAVVTDTATEAFAEDSAAITVATPAAVGLRKLVESAPGSGTFIEADDSDRLTGAYTAGDRVAWRLVVTNTGNAPLSEVVVSDPGLAGAAGAEPSADAACRDLATGYRIDSLAPGESVTLTCTAVEQESRVNTADVTAQWPDAPEGVEGTVTAEDDAAITVTPVPGTGGTSRSSGNGGGLAVTGAATLGVLAAAAALTLGGAALLRTRRRAQHRS
nr:SdrD B-like domain-containing protein [Cellulomonas denverensis]